MGLGVALRMRQAERRPGADALQRPLRSRFRARLRPGVMQPRQVGSQAIFGGSPNVSYRHRRPTHTATDAGRLRVLVALHPSEQWTCSAQALDRRGGSEPWKFPRW
jgi:hypothetical protein